MNVVRHRFIQFLCNNFFSKGVSSNVKVARTLLTNVNKYNAGLILFSFSLFSSSTTETKVVDDEKIKMNKKLEEADELYKQHKYRDVYNLLDAYRGSNDVEILWRLSRAMYNLSEEPTVSAEEKKQLIFESYSIIKRSLELDDGSFENHKWMSILLDARSSYDGIKARITHLESVKSHMLEALKLNSRDATTLYMLGLWCYQIADMPWYQRKIASAIFASPPSSSYEEALEYFVKAEEVEPRFYCQNLLMLGKTCLKLNKEDKARYYLDLACNYPVSADDDHLASKEATDLLKGLKGKR